MERENFIMFCLGAFSLAVGIIVQPYVKALWQWCKSHIPHRKNTQSTTDYQQQIDDLQAQINNIIETKYNRETNRKNNVRREIRDYLKELQTKQ